jgi:hypothetical protein
LRNMGSAAHRGVRLLTRRPAGFATLGPARIALNRPGP